MWLLHRRRRKRRRKGHFLPWDLRVDWKEQTGLQQQHHQHQQYYRRGQRYQHRAGRLSGRRLLHNTGRTERRLPSQSCVRAVRFVVSPVSWIYPGVHHESGALTPPNSSIPPPWNVERFARGTSHTRRLASSSISIAINSGTPGAAVLLAGSHALPPSLLLPPLLSQGDPPPPSPLRQLVNEPSCSWERHLTNGLDDSRPQQDVSPVQAPGSTSASSALQIHHIRIV